MKVKKGKYLCGPNDWSTQPNYSGRYVEQVRAVETSWTEFKDSYKVTKYEGRKNILWVEHNI